MNRDRAGLAAMAGTAVHRAGLAARQAIPARAGAARTIPPAPGPGSRTKRVSASSGVLDAPVSARRKGRTGANRGHIKMAAPAASRARQAGASTVAPRARELEAGTRFAPGPPGDLPTAV